MPSTGIVCGSRSVPKHEVEEQSRRIAGGLAAIDVRQGDCVAILMRNDIAFLTASYGAMMLGAYAVPINWHFAAEEIAYIFGDSGAKVLIGHADLLTLHGIAAASRIPVVCAETPPEIVAAYGIDPALLALPAGAIAFESWTAAQQPYAVPPLPQPQSMIYTSGTTGRPKGVRRQAPTADEQAKTEILRSLVYGIKPGVRALLPGPLYHSAPNSFGIQGGAPRRGFGADVALRRRRAAASHRAGADRYDLYGSNHVRPASQAAASGAPPLRRLVAALRDPCCRSLSCGRKESDDRMVGTRHIGVLRRYRVRTGDACIERRRVVQTRNRRQSHAGHGHAHP